MKYFLDANICIYALKDKYPRIKEKIAALKPSDIAIPSIVKAELYYGAFKSQNKSKTLRILERFLGPYEIIPFGDNEIKSNAEIRSKLGKDGVIIGPNDLIIASTAISNGAILVTHNTKEFQRVENLSIEDWAVL